MPAKAERQQPTLRIPIRINGTVYALRRWQDLTREEMAEYLAIQVELCCPDLPPSVRARLSLPQLTHICNLALGRERPPVDGEPTPIRAHPKSDPPIGTTGGTP